MAAFQVSRATRSMLPPMIFWISASDFFPDSQVPTNSRRRHQKAGTEYDAQCIT